VESPVTALPQPPTIKGRLLLGSLPEFREDPLGFLTRAARDYGDIVRFHFGPRPVYLLNHPDHIQDVLVTNSNKFIKGQGQQLAKRFLGQGLLTSSGEHHRRQRRLVQPAFHRQRINGYGREMVNYAVRARDSWKNGETLDVAEEMLDLTLAIVSKTLFNSEFDSDAIKIAHELSVQFFGQITRPFPLVLSLIPSPGNFRIRKKMRRLDENIYRIINERRKSGEDRGDLLSMLVAATDAENHGAGMSDKQVRDELLTLFVAGHETIATALTWTLYLLSQNPEVEAQMQVEIGKLGARPPAPDDIPQLKFVEMVVAESMRLYPPAWLIGRRAIEDYSIDRYTVPAGSIVMVSPYVTQRDARYFPDPLKFDPLRWTEHAKAGRPKFSFFPFGGGPRLCIGEPFAWMEGVLVIAALTQKWTFQLAKGQTVKPKPLITLRSTGIKMRVEGRAKAVKPFVHTGEMLTN
jgi:cytochrome P450